MRKVQLNEEIKSYTKTINGLSVLNISTYSKNILYFLFDYQYLPLSEEQLKKRGKVNREFTDKMIYTSLNINYRTYSKSIKELVAAGYLTISDDLIILNISKMVKDIHTINTTQIMPILKKGKINGLEETINETVKELTAEQQDSFNQLERMISAGIANEKDIEKYNKLKTLLYGNDDKEEDLEANEQETITNTTKEIKAEKQPKIETTTIEVEETQKEAVLDVKEEFEHKDTSSIIQPLKQPETFTKHEQTEEEMVQEYLNRLIEPTRVQILDIKKYIYQYFQTKDPKNLIDLEYQMRLYEKAQNDQDSHKAYDDRRSDWEDDISNYDEDGNLNLMDGDINL